MGQANALRLRRRTGGKDDLGKVAGSDCSCVVRRIGVMPDGFYQVFERLTAQHPFCADLGFDACGKSRSVLFVERNNDDASQQTSKERRYPCKTIRAPEDDAIAFGYPARFQLPRELIGSRRHSFHTSQS